MVGFLEGLLVGFVVLTAVYFMVSVYAGSVRREKLEDEFDTRGIAGDREAFIKAGMVEYRHSLRRRLILLVYVLPALAVAIIAFVVNSQ